MEGTSNPVVDALLGGASYTGQTTEVDEQVEEINENVTTNEETVNEELSQETKNERSAGIENQETQEVPVEDAQVEEIPSYSPEKFRELTEGKYESPEDLYQDYLKAQEEKETVFANDFIKRMNDYAKNGVNIDSNFLNEISNDWKSMNVKDENSAKKMIAMKLRLDNPNLDADDVEFKMRKTYSFDEEALRDRLEDKGYDDEKIEQLVQREKTDYLKQLEIDAKLAKPTLEKYQNDLVMPRGASAEDLAQQKEQERKEYMTDVSNTLKGFDKLEFKLSDGESLEVGVDKELTNTLKNDMNILYTDSAKFWEKHGGLAGLRDMIAMKYMQDSIVKEIENRVSNNATYDTVKNLRNQKPITNTTQAQKANTNESAIADALVGKIY